MNQSTSVLSCIAANDWLRAPLHCSVLIRISVINTWCSCWSFKGDLPCLQKKTGHQNQTQNSKVHGANMGPIWGRQSPGGPHVGPMNFAIWECKCDEKYNNLKRGKSKDSRQTPFFLANALYLKISDPLNCAVYWHKPKSLHFVITEHKVLEVEFINHNKNMVTNGK